MTHKTAENFLVSSAEYLGNLGELWVSEEYRSAGLIGIVASRKCAEEVGGRILKDPKEIFVITPGVDRVTYMNRSDLSPQSSDLLGLGKRLSLLNLQRLWPVDLVVTDWVANGQPDTNFLRAWQILTSSGAATAETPVVYLNTGFNSSGPNDKLNHLLTALEEESQSLPASPWPKWPHSGPTEQ